MVSFNGGLGSLPARPPTPPKENAPQLANDNEPGLLASSFKHLPLDTPDESPSSSAENVRSSVQRSRKKVGFSPWTEFHRPPGPGGKESDSEGSLQHLPPSKDCKSLKSILKICKEDTSKSFENEHRTVDRTDLAAILRSTNKNLAIAESDEHMRHYATLVGALGANDEVSNSTALSDEVVQLTEYIRRDILIRRESDGSQNTRLVAQVLKVVNCFLGLPNLSKLLPGDFCSFILDQYLSRIEDAGSPKTLTLHCMQVLEKGQFPSKLMTSERTGRLLAALNLVGSQLKGVRVVCHRLMIYRRLLIQAKSIMAARVIIWIEPLISGMLSSVKDVRNRAIGFGIEAALQLGTTKSVSQSCNEVFNRISPEGTKVIDMVSSRLTEMVGSREDGPHVPQIWSVIILFLRSRQRQLEHWEHLKAWLIIIQQCLNSSDPHVRVQANIAWCRLFFAINLDTSTSVSMAKVLRQPIMSQLERKPIDKSSKNAKQMARSAYCTLLYYTFRPTASPAQLDQYWDLYVAQILPTSFTMNKSDANRACEIFASLLSSNGGPKVWDENRANMSGSVKASELPCIDPKWIRSRAVSVTQVFTKLFDTADWQTLKACESPLLLAWRSFMAALGAASSKEIKVSMETMNAVSQIINLLKFLLEKGHKQLRDGSAQQQEAQNRDLIDSFGKFGWLAQEAVAAIGIIPFLERRIVLTSYNSFEATETPSSRSTRDIGSLNSPIMHLLTLLLTQVQAGQPSNTFGSAVKFLIDISLQNASTRRTQLGFLRDLARLYSTKKTIDRHISRVLWGMLAEATSSALRSRQSNNPHRPSEQYLGHEYRDFVKILEAGIQNRSDDIMPAWNELYGRIFLAIKSDAGNDGITILLSEPLAEVVRDTKSHCYLLVIAAKILDSTEWLQSQNQRERTQKLLWGGAYVPQKSKVDCLPGKVLDMTDAVLRSAYVHINMIPAESISMFLLSVASFIGSCPPEHCERMLSRISSGLVAWVEATNDGKGSSVDRFGVQVDNLWSKVVIAVERIRNYDTKLLFNIQHVLLVGFRSHRKSILNKSVVMWNHTFGCASYLEYPEALREQMLRVRSITNISLPALPDVEENDVEYSLVQFSESQDDFDMELPLPAKFAILNQGLSPSCSSHKLQDLLIPCRSPNVATKASPTVGSERNATPKARLRHNDSQIEFAAIESSPFADEPADSQQLTDRQKEVKERQVSDVAMFPEIRSSPKSGSRHTHYELPRLKLKEDLELGAECGTDKPKTLVYSPEIPMTDFLGSSPTPMSSKKGTDSTGAHETPYPLPSLLPSLTIFNQQVALSEKLERQTEPPLLDHDQRTGDICMDITLPLESNCSSSDVNISSSQAPPRHAENGSTLEPKPPAIKADDPVLSDSDVFVDALAGPIGETLAIGDAIEPGKFCNPHRANNVSQPANEEDQVTAQLVNEMERASSQQESKQEHAIDAKPGSEKKRKNVFGEVTRSHKKARSNIDLLDRQRGPEMPQVQEFAECVLINVRQTREKDNSSLSHVKTERSPSTCPLADIPVERDVPVPTHRAGRRSGKKPLRQMSHLDSSPSSSRSSARKSARLTGTPRSSPQTANPAPVENEATRPDLVTKTGRRRASKRWFWMTEEPREDNNQAVTNADADSMIRPDPKVTARQDQSSSWQESEHSQHPSREAAEVGESQEGGTRIPLHKDGDGLSQVEAPEASARSDPPTAEGILQGFKRMLESIKRVALGREEEREMVGVLFESVKEVHEAGRRSTAT